MVRHHPHFAKFVFLILTRQYCIDGLVYETQKVRPTQPEMVRG